MFDIINELILLALVMFSVYFDIKKRRIPNFLTFPVILWGLISSSIFSGLNGAIFSGGGFLVGLAVFFIPFAFGAMGAGDVKLMAAIGSLMGYKFVVNNAIITAIAGGIIVLVNSLINGTLYSLFKNIFYILIKGALFVLYKLINSISLYKKYKNINIKLSEYEKKYIPYAIAIGIGTMIVLSGKFDGFMLFK